MNGIQKNFQKEFSKRTTQVLERPLVLLHDDEDTLFRLIQEIFSQDVYFRQVELRKYEAGLNPALVVIRARHVQDAASLMHTLRAKNPLTEYIVIGSQWSLSQMMELVNGYKIHRLLAFPINQERLKEAIKSALVGYEYSFSRSLLHKEATTQNKNLEVLNANLEKIVEDRTLHIQASKEEEEQRLNQLRHMIRFIKDLALISSIDELLLLVRKELRKFSKIGEPLILFQTHKEWSEVYSYQSGSVFHSRLRQKFSLSESVNLHDIDLTREMANAIGRPIARMTTIPIETQLMKRVGYSESQVRLCIETSMRDEESRSLIEFLQVRLQAIAVTVDRLLLENELVNYSYRWEKTFDGLRDPISIIDHQYNVLRANRKFSDKIIQEKCYQVFAHRESPCEGCELQQSLLERKSWTYQIINGQKTYEVHSYPIQFQSDGQATNVINQYVDITEAREIYIRLLQSEKMGALGLLAGNIAHELNNPLTGLRSLAQVLIAQEKARPQLQSDLQEIEKAAARSQEIIKNLMEFSKGGAGELVTTTLDEVVNRTMPMLKSVIRRHRYQINLNAQAARIKVFPAMLQQVVFNLINNACQAMMETGNLFIETNVDREKSAVYLTVQDSGPGIPMEIQSKIFEPFFTTKKEGQGTGLGLSFSRDVVRNMGGEIRVESTPGHGAKFIVEIPIAGGK
ncbi:MAG: hypothetical protein BroJett040_05390 [Oligoflexia bacterium]|nr:MAG: hypothetical protein BroJett040_05390 [Oligoflexia bacterium]